MNEGQYWRQRYEMLMANFGDAVRTAIDTHSAPRYLADAESYNLGKLHGAIEEREACADLCYQLVNNSRETRFAAAIRARGQS